VWKCANCGGIIDDKYVRCWRCLAPKAKNMPRSAPPVVSDTDQPLDVNQKSDGTVPEDGAVDERHLGEYLDERVDRVEGEAEYEDVSDDEDDTEDTVEPERYPVLQTISSICRVIGWISVIIGVIGVVTGLLNIVGGRITGYLTMIASLGIGAIASILLFAFAELIKLLTDIEYNTRKNQ
jgi:hypothetical protein